ncbi:protein of unknown function DUF433 (plasmid) [Stanieria cyanosphaera PCC 7437]|uniref:DUF433 domain-containing protein n=1 Tax=Stanieria cyanosphaera (strain ATCC 29371 / PCC 7437) TaxID=111780 RepID=K9XZN3_STAC7|nr:protein of unknown function DUF433 [Stanieria cyanosphaera PCC 7437]
MKERTLDLNICSGKPFIKGHRIWVSLILDLLAAGETIEEILSAYPSISREDVLACIACVQKLPEIVMWRFLCMETKRK